MLVTRKCSSMKINVELMHLSLEARHFNHLVCSLAPQRLQITLMQISKVP